MHGGEDDGRGRAVRQQRVEEGLGALPRDDRIGVAQLGREGVGVQPVEQLGAEAGDDVELRAVDVGVDETGQQQAAAVVFGLPLGAGGEDAGRLGAEDLAVLDQQPVVRAPAHAGRGVGRIPARVGGEIKQVGAQRQSGSGHERAKGWAVRRRATSRTVSRSQRSDAALCVTSCQSW